MEKLTIGQVQQLGYQMLEKFNEIAKENNLTYYLSGGTCLGAIRHEGFIPWDDDIDLLMPREDYDKFIQIVSNNENIFGESPYHVCKPLDDNYYCPFLKIINTDTVVYEKNIHKRYKSGVWVDIFPLDYCDNDVNNIEKDYRKFMFYKMMLQFNIQGKLDSLKKRALMAIAYVPLSIINFGKNDKYWIQKILNLTNKPSSDKVAAVVWRLDNRELYFPISWFQEVKYVKFEGGQFPIFTKYHEYLTMMYGDYMKIPDEKDRVVHDFEGYLTVTETKLSNKSS